MKDPTILAFMQNAWFPAGTSKEAIDKYKTDQEFHRRLLARTMSGGRLLSAFGPDMYNRIWWDNVSQAHTEEADGVAPIDMEHVERCIMTVKPDVIIGFGRLAEMALDSSLFAMDIDYFICHHPNARHRTAADLSDFAILIQQWCDQWRIRS